LEDLFEYLSSKGLNPKQAGEGNLRALCPFHGEEEGKPGRLYVQNDDGDKWGLLFCFVCNVRGTINKLRKHFGDALLDLNPNEEANPIVEVAAQYYHDRLFENYEAYLYLEEERGLNEKTIVQARLGYADGNLGLHLLQKGYLPEQIKESGLMKIDGTDYFKDEIIFPYLKYGRAMQLRGKKIGGKTRSMTGIKAMLYNGDAILGEDTVTIEEGEIDVLTMQQLGYNAVGVPGALVWKPEWTDQLEDAKRVYILFDADSAGRSGAEKLAQTIGPRSRIVELPKKGIDVNDYFVKYAKQREDFDFLFSKAKGGLLVTMHQAFEKWTEIEGNDHLVGLPFNIGPLDKAMTYGQLPGQVVVTLARTDAGKGHPYDTDIQTPEGLRKWGDLKVGDEVFGSDGRPIKVTALHERGVIPTYRVSFGDGTSVLCDGDHIWSVHKYSWNRNRFDFRNLSTKQLIDDGLYSYKSNGTMFYKYNIQMSKPVHYAEQNLPIEPYTIGTLLSNGYLGGCGTEFRTPDVDVAERVAAEGSDLRDRVTSPEACDNYGVAGVRHLTRELGIDVLSGDKFIPQMYLQASLEQRVNLLQGLFDGDGSNAYYPGMQVLYHTTSNKLALDVQILVHSLGGTATIAPHDRVGNNGKPYQDITMCCMIPEVINSFSTIRKNVEKKYTNKHLPRRAITKIEYVGEKAIRCITVAAKDSLYLIGKEYIVTHNSIDAINKMFRNRLVDNNFKCLFISLEQTRNEVFERLHRIHNFYDPGVTVMGTIDYWKDNLLIVDKNRLTERELEDCIEQVAYEIGKVPDKVVVDYLGYYSRSFAGNAKERTSEAIMGLKRIGKDFETIIETPVQGNRTGEIGEAMTFEMAADASEVEHTANIMMSLWKPEQKIITPGGKESSHKPGDVYTQIIKSKNGGSGTIVKYHFAPLTLAMIPSDDPLYDRAIQERAYAAQGLSWKEAVQLHMNNQVAF
jgi:replicative DNA helicase